MNRELAYAIITPYTISKSRTGAVLARLLGRTSSQLVAAQMFAPTADLAERYARSIKTSEDVGEEHCRALIRNYIREHFSPAPGAPPRRVLMLVFAGENARQDVAKVVGHLSISSTTGETIRDTYGDLVRNADGTVQYFEPAVIRSSKGSPVKQDLQLWLDFARTQSPILEKACTYERNENIERTLVLIKPDSWRQSSSRPGAIVDMFSRTGLRIIGCNRIQMTVSQAMEFYGPVRDILCQKLSPGIAVQAREILERELDIELPEAATEMLREGVGVPYAVNQFEKIVEFMSGMRPSACPREEWDNPGKTSCLALVYEGENAVNKIRDVLGPTDPTKAPSGTVRREFGSDVMVNTAHASDSPENAQREMGILKLNQSSFVPVVESLLKEYHSYS